MSENQKSIAVFDSGIGGLTVLREIRKLLPNENLIYLGDTAHVPYGTKSPDIVRRYTVRNALFLLQQGIKGIVVACNTATAYGLSTLNELFQVPVLGVIEPGAKAALVASKSGCIGIIGTEGTIRSQAYQNALESRKPNLKIMARACSLLVSLAEEGWTSGPIAEATLQTYLKDWKEIDTLILGCTHYPLFKEAMGPILGSKVALVDSAVETALALQKILQEKGLNHPQTSAGSLTLYSTDSPERMQKLGEQFMGQALPKVQQVYLESF